MSEVEVLELRFGFIVGNLPHIRICRFFGAGACERTLD
jgi:hypothetical protein